MFMVELSCIFVIVGALIKTPITENLHLFSSSFILFNCTDSRLKLSFALLTLSCK